MSGAGAGKGRMIVRAKRHSAKKDTPDWTEFLDEDGNIKSDEELKNAKSRDISARRVKMHALQAGLKSVSQPALQVAQAAAFKYILRVQGTAATITAHAKRKTMSANDVNYAAARNGQRIAGINDQLKDLKTTAGLEAIKNAGKKRKRPEGETKDGADSGKGSDSTTEAPAKKRGKSATAAETKAAAKPEASATGEGSAKRAPKAKAKSKGKGKTKAAGKGKTAPAVAAVVKGNDDGQAAGKAAPDSDSDTEPDESDVKETKKHAANGKHAGPDDDDVPMKTTSGRGSKKATPAASSASSSSSESSAASAAAADSPVSP